MLHIIYIFAFTILALLAIGNLIRSLVMIGLDSRSYGGYGWNPVNSQRRSTLNLAISSPHPELLDGAGRILDEPLLVMRSMTVEDAREQLDALYRSSPGGSSDSQESSNS